VHARGRINGADRKAIENVARYMSRAAISVERVRYNRAQDSVTVTKKPFGSSPEESRSYPGRSSEREGPLGVGLKGFARILSR